MSPISLALFLVVSSGLGSTSPSNDLPPPPPPAEVGSGARNEPLPPPPPDLPLPPPPDDSTPTPPPPAPDAPFTQKVHTENVQHRVSMTLSPLLLILPIVQVTGEFRVSDKMGVAAVFGLGSVLSFFTVQLGAQFRYYLLGSFIHGLDLGAQVLTLALFDNGGSLAAGGISLAPFVGYKIATNIGFTFDAQIGPDFALVGASSSLTGQNTDASGAIGLLLNLNVGWSF